MPRSRKLFGRGLTRIFRIFFFFFLKKLDPRLSAKIRVPILVVALLHYAIRSIFAFPRTLLTASP
ncbi:MAG TPA: hypothetical protein PKD98_25290, partial [Anaerolineae bacterium]|nr:hypothetical protein [Anaerolineae bacterium]